MQDETDLESGCPQLVGFLFKRRCGRKDRTDCPYCKGVAPAAGADFWAPERDPYFADRSLYPNYQKYDWWVSDQTGSVDFFDADGVTLLNDDDSDFDFELDPEAS